MAQVLGRRQGTSYLWGQGRKRRGLKARARTELPADGRVLWQWGWSLRCVLSISYREKQQTPVPARHLRYGKGKLRIGGGEQGTSQDTENSPVELSGTLSSRLQGERATSHGLVRIRRTCPRKILVKRNSNTDFPPLMNCVEMNCALAGVGAVAGTQECC